MAGQFIIAVPEILGDKNLAPFYRGWKWHDEPGDEVVLDFSRSQFIAPWAAAMFGAYGKWLQEVRHRSVQVWLDEGSTAGRFLNRMRFREFLGDPEKRQAPVTDSDRLVPLTQVLTSKDIQPCVSAIMQLLAVDDQDTSDAIRYALIELLRNVVQHSRSGIGAVVTGAYMPSTGIASLAVADYGCGVRASLHERYREIRDDYRAVKFALQPHVSGTFQRGAYESMADNAGLGLFFIKEIATRTGGGFFLGSGAMLADLWGYKDGTPGKRYFSASGTGWRGTFALLQMRRNHVVEFDSLLQHCREIAAAVRQDPTELKLDFIDEVPELMDLVVVRVKDFEEDVEAARAVREARILPALANGQMVVLDFSGIRAATQSFAHALMYRILRDGTGLEHSLSIASADGATREAVKAVAAYARASDAPTS